MGWRRAPGSGHPRSVSLRVDALRLEDQTIRGGSVPQAVICSTAPTKPGSSVMVPVSGDRWADRTESVEIVQQVLEVDGRVVSEEATSGRRLRRSPIDRSARGLLRWEHLRRMPWSILNGTGGVWHGLRP